MICTDLWSILLNVVNQTSLGNEDMWNNKNRGKTYSIYLQVK